MDNTRSHEIQKFVRFDDFGNRFVEIHTEVKSSNGTTIRCDPQYPQSGPWYDWGIFEWQVRPEEAGLLHAEPCLDIYQGSGDPLMRKFTHNLANLINKGHIEDFRDALKSDKTWLNFREIVTDLSKHLSHEKYKNRRLNPQHQAKVFLPAKIIGIIVESRPPHDTFLILHACEYLCKTNSLIGRQWILEYRSSKNGGAQLPQYNIQPLSSLVCPCFVVEECPVLFEHKPQSVIVTEVFDRKVAWGQTFVKLCKQGLHQCEFKDSSRTAPALTTKLIPKKTKKQKKTGNDKVSNEAQEEGKKTEVIARSGKTPKRPKKVADTTNSNGMRSNRRGSNEKVQSSKPKKRQKQQLSTKATTSK